MCSCAVDLSPPAWKPVQKHFSSLKEKEKKHFWQTVKNKINVKCEFIKIVNQNVEKNKNQS